MEVKSTVLLFRLEKHWPIPLQSLRNEPKGAQCRKRKPPLSAKKKKNPDNRWFFLHCLCEPDPVRGEAQNVRAAVLTLLEASRSSRLIPVMFVISRGPWAGKAEYFADVQVFFVRTKPLHSVCCPNMCCLWGQQLEAQAVGFRLWALRPGPGSRGLSSMLNQQQCGFCPLLVCTCKGLHRPLPPDPLRWDWGGRANSAPPEENQHQAACSLHSSAITALVRGPPGTAASFILAFPAWLGEINQTKKSLWIQITCSLPKVGCLFSPSPESTRVMPASVSSRPGVGRGMGLRMGRNSGWESHADAGSEGAGRAWSHAFPILTWV